MNVPRFFTFLLRRSPGMVLAMLGAGLLSGAFSAGILAVINRVLHESNGHTTMLLVAFIVLVTGKIVSNGVSQLLLVRFGQNAILDVSLTLCERITQAPLRFLERRGQSRILATLTDDVSHVVWAIQCLPQLTMNVAIVLGCGLYLAWLSWVTFLGVLGVTLLGVVGYWLLHRRAFAVIYAARDARSTLFRHFSGLIDGIKELLMHRARRTEFVQQEIRFATANLRRFNLTATTHYAVADAWTQGLFYALIGLLLFVFSEAARLPPESVTGYVFAMLYMMNPIWSVIGTVPTIGRGQVALDEIEDLGGSLTSMKGDSEPSADSRLGRASHSHVELQRVRFQYEKDPLHDQGFALGPIDFELRPGELVFVVGGNGSGKSTFVKVLTGLYPPDQGEVRLGGRPIGEADLAWYREHFAVVFSDFFLFEKLFGIDAGAVETKGLAYLRTLQIDQKVSLIGQKFSTTDLSQGQRKRLALVTAYLEDRPFYVFDEWAADQDPQYKDIFYTKLLPDLRERGKAVVVITHDDRYFHLGDRVVKLDEGRIVRVWRPGAEPVVEVAS